MNCFRLNQSADCFRRGFTLMELLVVIAIMGVLVATFAFSTVSARENARTVKATAEARELSNAIRLYAMIQMDTELSGDDPLADLGLREGLVDASTTLTKSLTEPNEKNGETVFYNANAKSIRGGRLCDPWGHPYKIRIRKVSEGEADKSEANDYKIILPIPGRHRRLDVNN